MKVSGFAITIFDAIYCTHSLSTLCTSAPKFSSRDAFTTVLLFSTSNPHFRLTLTHPKLLAKTTQNSCHMVSTESRENISIYIFSTFKKNKPTGSNKHKINSVWPKTSYYLQIMNVAIYIRFSNCVSHHNIHASQLFVRESTSLRIMMPDGLFITCCCNWSFIIY